MTQRRRAKTMPALLRISQLVCAGSGHAWTWKSVGKHLFVCWQDGLTLNGICASHDSMIATNGIEGQEALPPPFRLYERLAQLSGYTWDQSIEPFHSVSEV